MKLRIQDDSLRLRLTRQEVADLGAGNPVERAIHFPGNRKLTYAVHSSAGVNSASVTFSGDTILVDLPRPLVTTWATTNEVSIEGTDGELRLLVEKDFQCLHQDQDPEAFPNPLR